MKLRAWIHPGSETRERDVELVAQEQTKGSRRFTIGDEIGDADCEEISPGVYSLLISGRGYEAVVSRQSGDSRGNASPYAVTVGTRQYVVQLRDPRRRRRMDPSVTEPGPREVVAPMPGKIVRVLVREGQEVKPGEGLLVIEAMKMQNELRSPRAGRVDRVYMAEGRGVEAGARLIRLV